MQAFNISMAKFFGALQNSSVHPAYDYILNVCCVQGAVLGIGGTELKNL